MTWRRGTVPASLPVVARLRGSQKVRALSRRNILSLLTLAIALFAFLLALAIRRWCRGLGILGNVLCCRFGMGLGPRIW